MGVLVRQGFPGTHVGCLVENEEHRDRQSASRPGQALVLGLLCQGRGERHHQRRGHLVRLLGEEVDGVGGVGHELLVAKPGPLRVAAWRDPLGDVRCGEERGHLYRDAVDARPLPIGRGGQSVHRVGGQYVAAGAQDALRRHVVRAGQPPVDVGDGAPVHRGGEEQVG